jgi:hypothetical protein
MISLRDSYFRISNIHNDYHFNVKSELESFSIVLAFLVKNVYFRSLMTDKIADKIF